MKAPVTVIISTGDRHKCMKLCLSMLSNQTVTPAQVIVIDDGYIPSHDVASSPFVDKYIRRLPGIQDPPHTLPVNILVALKAVTQQSIIFMEDDEWYHPEYIATLWNGLSQGYSIVGQENSLYYRFPSRTWKYQNNMRHASLCVTGLREDLYVALAKCCENCISVGTGFVDMTLWSLAYGQKSPFALTSGNYHVGMKGLPGRRGKTSGWLGASTEDGYTPDPDMVFLQSIIGNDVNFYKKGAELWHQE